MNRALQRPASPYDIVKAVRRNHGIEHGTVTVLLEQGFSPPMGGNATPSGFYIYSGASADKVEAAAMEALSRMAAGEGELAVSPYCGTNLVVSALVAAVGAYLAARVSGSRRAHVLGPAVGSPGLSRFCEAAGGFSAEALHYPTGCRGRRNRLCHTPSRRSGGHSQVRDCRRC